ncbi:MAG: hypothetical protein ACK5RK_07360 [Betaproteobacteria bacterium]
MAILGSVDRDVSNEADDAVRVALAWPALAQLRGYVFFVYRGSKMFRGISRWVLSVLALLAGLLLLVVAFDLPLFLGASFACFAFAVFVNPSAARRIRWLSGWKRMASALCGCVFIGLGFLVGAVALHSDKSPSSSGTVAKQENSTLEELETVHKVASLLLATSTLERMEVAISKLIPDTPATYEYRAVGSMMGGPIRICGTLHAGTPVTSAEFVFADGLKDRPLRIRLKNDAAEKDWVDFVKTACDHEYAEVVMKEENVKLGKYSADLKKQ